MQQRTPAEVLQARAAGPAGGAVAAGPAADATEEAPPADQLAAAATAAQPAGDYEAKAAPAGLLPLKAAHPSLAASSSRLSLSSPSLTPRASVVLAPPRREGSLFGRAPSRASTLSNVGELALSDLAFVRKARLQRGARRGGPPPAAMASWPRPHPQPLADIFCRWPPAAPASPAAAVAECGGCSAAQSGCQPVTQLLAPRFVAAGFVGSRLSFRECPISAWHRLVWHRGLVRRRQQRCAPRHVREMLLGRRCGCTQRHPLKGCPERPPGAAGGSQGELSDNTTAHVSCRARRPRGGAPARRGQDAASRQACFLAGGDGFPAGNSRRGQASGRTGGCRHARAAGSFSLRETRLAAPAAHTPRLPQCCARWTTRASSALWRRARTRPRWRRRLRTA